MCNATKIAVYHESNFFTFVILRPCLATNTIFIFLTICKYIFINWIGHVESNINNSYFNNRITVGDCHTWNDRKYVSSGFLKKHSFISLLVLWLKTYRIQKLNSLNSCKNSQGWWTFLLENGNKLTEILNWTFCTGKNNSRILTRYIVLL